MSDIFELQNQVYKPTEKALQLLAKIYVGNENYAQTRGKSNRNQGRVRRCFGCITNTSYGVKVDGITRAFDQFIDLQLQNASSGLSFATSQTLILEKLEQVLHLRHYSINKLNDLRLSTFATLQTGCKK